MNGDQPNWDGSYSSTHTGCIFIACVCLDRYPLKKEKLAEGVRVIGKLRPQVRR